MKAAKDESSWQQAASRLVSVEVPLEAAVARLCERKPAAIVSARFDDLTEMENQRWVAFRPGRRTPPTSGYCAWRQMAGGRAKLATVVSGSLRRTCEAAFRAWAAQSRQVYGHGV